MKRIFIAFFLLSILLLVAACGKNTQSNAQDQANDANGANGDETQDVAADESYLEDIDYNSVETLDSDFDAISDW